MAQTGWFHIIWLTRWGLTETESGHGVQHQYLHSGCILIMTMLLTMMVLVAIMNLAAVVIPSGNPHTIHLKTLDPET